MAVVAQVHPSKVHQIWPLVEKYFAAVEPFTEGDYTLEQMRGKIFMSQWALITVTEGDEVIGALSAFYENRLNHRVAFIPALAGECMTTQDNWNQLKAIFTSNGATYIEAAMRNATLRLWNGLGFKEKYRIAGVAI